MLKLGLGNREIMVRAGFDGEGGVLGGAIADVGEAACLAIPDVFEEFVDGVVSGLPRDGHSGEGFGGHFIIVLPREGTGIVGVVGVFSEFAFDGFAFGEEAKENVTSLEAELGSG